MRWNLILLLFTAYNAKNKKDVAPILSSYLESKFCSEPLTPVIAQQGLVSIIMLSLTA
jgi:hypothetical protein